MTPTPRTDAHIRAQQHTYSPSVDPDFARQLERELAQAKARIAALEEHVHGDAIENYCLKEDLRDAGEGTTKLNHGHD